MEPDAYAGKPWLLLWPFPHVSLLSMAFAVVLPQAVPIVKHDDSQFWLSVL